MSIQTIVKTLKLDDGRETMFTFNQLEGQGFSINQVDYIMNIVHYYLQKYERLVINKISDFCSNEETFYSDENGLKYSDMPTFAEYFYDSKEILLNHIRVSEMPDETVSFIEKIDALAAKVSKVEDMIDKMKLHAMNIQVPFEDLKDNFRKDPIGSSFIKELSENEIQTDPLVDGVYSIYLIRKLEYQEFIKRIIIHEIGHAIVAQYNICTDQGIGLLFKKYEKDFEDIQEFLAECFMASEFSDNIRVAKSVRGIINKYTEVWN